MSNVVIFNKHFPSTVKQIYYIISARATKGNTSFNNEDFVHVIWSDILIRDAKSLRARHQ
jgi:hypothetical protein